MFLPNYLASLLRSARIWIALGVLAPLGMLIVSGLMLLDLRQDAWDKAEQTSKNLLQVIERDIARNVELIDLSIQAVRDNLRAPGLARLDPEMRQLVLFDRSASARDLGVMIVLDENADIVSDAAAVTPRGGNYADRDYFQAHKVNPRLGLLVGRPIVSRLTGERMLTFTRRIDKPDGTFGGLVLGSLKLSFFAHLFDQIGLGDQGAINLYLRDGTRITRHPYLDADVGVNNLVAAIDRLPVGASAIGAYHSALRRRGEAIADAGGPAALNDVLARVRASAPDRPDVREAILDTAWTGIAGWRR